MSTQSVQDDWSDKLHAETIKCTMYAAIECDNRIFLGEVYDVIDIEQ